MFLDVRQIWKKWFGLPSRNIPLHGSNRSATKTKLIPGISWRHKCTVNQRRSNHRRNKDANRTESSDLRNPKKCLHELRELQKQESTKEPMKEMETESKCSKWILWILKFLRLLVFDCFLLKKHFCRSSSKQFKPVKKCQQSMHLNWFYVLTIAPISFVKRGFIWPLNSV